MNQDDRRLLELAAKAARENLIAWQGTSPICRNDAGYTYKWNPLTDDGDAFRLAVKLDIEIYSGDDDGAMTVWAGYEIPHPGDNRIMYACEQHKGDPYAATRRAIVRAAAAMGEQMP